MLLEESIPESVDDDSVLPLGELSVDDSVTTGPVPSISTSGAAGVSVLVEL